MRLFSSLRWMLENNGVQSNHSEERCLVFRSTSETSGQSHMEDKEVDRGQTTHEGKAKAWSLVFILKAMVKTTGAFEEGGD